MADRYTYVPLIGLFIAISWSCGDLVEAARSTPSEVRNCTSRPLWSWSCAHLLSWVQASYWQDSSTLWKHALQVDEKNYAANNMLGCHYLMKGLPEEAMSYLERAVELNPGNAPYRCQYAMAGLMTGNIALAKSQLSKALRLNPNAAELHHQLALSHVLAPEPDLDRALRK